MKNCFFLLLFFIICTGFYHPEQIGEIWKNNEDGSLVQVYGVAQYVNWIGWDVHWAKLDNNLNSIEEGMESEEDFLSKYKKTTISPPSPLISPTIHIPTYGSVWTHSSPLNPHDVKEEDKVVVCGADFWVWVSSITSRKWLVIGVRQIYHNETQFIDWEEFHTTYKFLYEYIL